MRPEKQLIVDELRQSVAASTYVLLTDYTGLTVGQFGELRKRLRDANAECHVVKNTLLVRAIEAAGLPKPETPLTGMTAIVLGRDKSDVSSAARIIKKFSQEFQRPKFKLGVMGRQLLKAEDVSALADLPSLDALRAQLIGLLQAPATKMAVILSAPGAQIARVTKARADKEGAAQPAVA